MKIVFFFNDKCLSGKLTKLFTGCYAYHVGFLDEERGYLYDMKKTRRKKRWPYAGRPGTRFEIFNDPTGMVTNSFLDEKISRAEDDSYGVIDYVFFALRPLFHLFGRATRNYGGIICSEQVNNDLWECFRAKYPALLTVSATPFSPSFGPPSPCELYKFFVASSD